MKKTSMLKMKFANVFLFCCLAFVSFAQQKEATHTYLNEFSFKDATRLKLKGPARIIKLDGREGLLMNSIKSTLELKAHTLNNPKGTLSIWFMPVEDMSPYDNKPHFTISNPNYSIYPFLSDHDNPQDYNKANFKLAWTTRWHPSISALFGKGSFYEQAFNMPHKAFISVSHATFKKNTWYQLALTWNYAEDKYNLYLNGILIGTENAFNKNKFHRDTVNSSLYTGNPTLAISTIKFYDEVLTEQKIHQEFKSSATSFNEELEKELIGTYNGKGLGTFNWKPDSKWEKKLSIDFDKPADLDQFYVQGKPVKVEVNKEGLLMETIDSLYTGKLLDYQVYLWSKKPFEGDLYVEYDFKVQRPGGLSLLMVQASGMNREDFMADYPLRTSGRMTMVYGEDVRNYHWEYYREMADMRNDVENSALIKNPFGYPLSFSALTHEVEKEVWHKIQFLQIGNKLIGAIDGVKMVEFTDNGFNNNGPVYNYGHIAIRCMLHTKMVFKNLRVYNKPTFETKKTFE